MEKELYNSLVLDTYIKLIKAKYPDILVEDLMAYADIENHEIGDASVWFTQEQVNRFHEKLSMLTDNLKIANEAGRFAANPKCLGELRGMILSLGGICNAFKLMGKYAKRLSRSSTYETRKIKRNTIEVTVTPHEGVEEQEFQCQNRRGNFRGIADLFFYKDIKISHPECMFQGGNCCRYVISWHDSVFSIFNRLKWMSGLAAAGIFTYHITPTGSQMPGSVVTVSLLVFLALAWIAEAAKSSRLKSTLSDNYENKEQLLKQIDINSENSRVIIEIGQALREARPDACIFDQIAEITGRRLKYDRVMIMTADDDRTQLQYRGGSGFNADEQDYLENYRISLTKPSEGVFNEAFMEGRPIIVNDMQLLRKKSSRRSYRLAEFMNPVAFIICPISFADTVVGIIVAGNINTPKKMGRNDKNLMMGVAQQIGGAYHKQKLEEEYAAFNKQVVRLQRMEALGVLAGGIAHDFNNILSPIVGYTDLCLTTPVGDESITEYLDQIRKASIRAQELVRQILAFSRQGEQEFIRIQIGPIVKETLQLLRASIPATIVIKKNIYPNLKPVMADPTLVHQVVMNLCTNAYQAMKDEGGVLTVRLTEETFDTGKPGDGLYLEPGSYIHLSVSDTGYGMSREVMDKIFEPYFTTKEHGKGTGLGLSITHNIVEQLKGRIAVHSTPSQGTCFDVYLPQIEAASSNDHEAPHLKTARGSESIMVVDDEPSILSMFKEILRDDGYEVVCFDDSIKAFEWFCQNQDGVNLVVTDMTMPGMCGTALAKKMMGINPHLPVILCTGYSSGINEKTAAAMGIRAFFMKPVIPGQLTLAIRNILDAK